MNTHLRRQAGLAKGRATQAQKRGKISPESKKAIHDKQDTVGHSYHSFKDKK